MAVVTLAELLRSGCTLWASIYDGGTQKCFLTFMQKEMEFTLLI